MKVRDIYRLGETKGDFGVEIEVEGRDLPRHARLWRGEEDGSLRGESREYVLVEPTSLPGVEEAMKSLNEAFKEHHSLFHESYRAGVHVHVNVQELSGIQLASMITAYRLLEGALVNDCNPDRRGNHFCLRTQDAPYSNSLAAAAFSLREPNTLNTDNLRYSAMNLASLHKYGSIEFRSLESTIDPERIVTFCRRHKAIRDFAEKVNNPVEVVQNALAWGPHKFFQQVLGPKEEALLEYATSYNDWETGLEFAEDLAYCHQWGKKSADIFCKKANYW